MANVDHTLTQEAAGLNSSDWAFDLIFGKIVRGDLPAGQRVTEASLCELSGVSRTPLRDALKRLEMYGILVRQRNRGLRVAAMTVEEMLRLSMLREVIEGLLVRHVTLRHARGEVSLAPLEALIVQMEAVDPRQGLTLLLSLGEQFHTALSELSGDALAARMRRQVMLSLERYRHLVDSDRDRAMSILKEHRSVIDAIRTGDGDFAEAEMRKHLAKAREVYAARLSAKVNARDNPQPEKRKEGRA